MDSPFDIRDMRPRDLAEADRIAEMWFRSQEGWPGGWNGGQRVTAAQQLEQEERHNPLATLLAVEGAGEAEEVIGYCRLERQGGRPDLAYVALLNVRQDRRGRGIGKALVLACLERARAAGCPLLSIGTWAGNLSAVPLYKRCGFNWIPETNVEMLNFVPAALTLPIAQPYFAQHDWYATMACEIAVEPDDVRWHGQRVYPYRWRGGDGAELALWVDSRAEALTAVETEDWYLACWVRGWGAGEEDDEVVGGLPAEVTWELVNRRPERGPRRLSLSAVGDEGLPLRLTESVEVAERVVLRRTFTPPADLPRRPDGLPARQIRSTVLLPDGTPVELGSAVNWRAPFEISLNAPRLSPGRPSTRARLQLRSRLPRAVRAEVRLEPAPGLDLPAGPLAAEAPARGWAGVPLTVGVAAEDVYRSTARVTLRAADNPGLPLDGRDLPLAPQPLVFRAAARGRLLVWEDAAAETWQIETPTLSLTVRKRGGGVPVAAFGGPGLGYLDPPSAGPVWGGWQVSPPLVPVEVRRVGEQVEVVQTWTYEALPDLRVERTLTVGAGPLLRIALRVLNDSDAEQIAPVHVGLGTRGEPTVYLPLTGGLVRAPDDGWGDLWSETGDMPTEPGDYAEGWLAEEWTNGLVVGSLYGGCARRERHLTSFALATVPAHGAVALDVYHVYGGPGDWRQVRAAWRELYGDPDTYEPEPPRPGPVTTVGWTPAGVVDGAGGELALTMVNRRGKGWRGSVTLEAADAGLRLAPAAAELADVRHGADGVVAVSATVTDPRPRAVAVTARMADAGATREFAVPLVVVGDGASEVRCTEVAGGWAVDNGEVAFTAGGGVQAAVHSLVWRGAERLHASWPEARPFAEWNPWRGGLYPWLAWSEAPWWAAQASTIDVVERVGAGGRRWRGVRLTAEPTHHDQSWRRLETEFLTTGGSNLLAVVQRHTNLTSAPQRGECGLNLSLAAAADGRPARVHYLPIDGEERAYSCEPTGRGQGRLHWVAAEGAGGDGVITWVGTHPYGDLCFDSRLQAGLTLDRSTWRDLDPGESHEVVGWLALADDVEQARLYRALGGVGLV